MGDGTSAIVITVKKADNNQTLNSFIDRELTALKIIHPGYESTDYEDIIFLENPAIKVTGTYSTGGAPVKIINLYTIVDDMEIALTWASSPGINNEPFQMIIDSFTLKKDELAVSGKLEIWTHKDGIYSLSYPDILQLIEVRNSNSIFLKNNANHTVMKVNIRNSTINLDTFTQMIQDQMSRENITILDVSHLTIDQNPGSLIIFEQSNAKNLALKGFEIYISLKDSNGNQQILSLISAYPSEQFNEIYPVMADIVNSVRIPAKSKDKNWYFDPYEYMSIDDWIEYGILTDYIDYGLDFDLWNYGYGLTFTDADYLEDMIGWDNYYLYDTDTSSWYREYDPTYIADLWAMDPDDYFTAAHLVETAYDDF